MSTMAPERVCLCNNCGHGPGEDALVSAPDIFAESFCGIADINDEGRYEPGYVMPVFTSGANPRTCRRLEDFEARLNGYQEEIELRPTGS